MILMQQMRQREAPFDTNWGNVVLNVQGGAPVGSTTARDLSRSGNTFTLNGGAGYANTNTLFSRTSISVGSGYCNTNTSADFGFGAGDYSLEWAGHNSGSAADRCLFDTRSASNAGVAVYLYTTASPGNLRVFDNAAPLITAAIAGGQLFIELCRVSGVLYVFINGTLAGSAADARTYASSSALYVGANYLGTQPLGSGSFIDSVRVTKGVGRYTATHVLNVPFPDR